GLDRLLVGVDAAFSHLPPVALDPVQQSRIRQGQALRWPEDPGQGTWRRLYGADGGFIGVAELVRGQLQPRRLMNL
ncbi:MAG TPA: tRNA pseudouridine(55) synthase TruB, partial [Bryobacterales bacterium]|nr:tRNA pseudouridine(55) synthase TruB [Bryobacterales bacterium]